MERTFWASWQDRAAWHPHSGKGSRVTQRRKKLFGGNNGSLEKSVSEHSSNMTLSNIFPFRELPPPWKVRREVYHLPPPCQLLALRNRKDLKEQLRKCEGTGLLLTAPACSGVSSLPQRVDGRDVLHQMFYCNSSRPLVAATAPPAPRPAAPC